MLKTFISKVPISTATKSSILSLNLYMLIQEFHPTNLSLAKMGNDKEWQVKV